MRRIRAHGAHLQRPCQRPVRQVLRQERVRYVRPVDVARAVAVPIRMPSHIGMTFVIQCYARCKIIHRCAMLLNPFHVSRCVALGKEVVEAAPMAASPQAALRAPRHVNGPSDRVQTSMRIRVQSGRTQLSMPLLRKTVRIKLHHKNVLRSGTRLPRQGARRAAPHHHQLAQRIHRNVRGFVFQRRAKLHNSFVSAIPIEAHQIGIRRSTRRGAASKHPVRLTDHVHKVPRDRHAQGPIVRRCAKLANPLYGTIQRIHL